MDDEIYFSLKQTTFLGRSVAIVCQTENGPCPLLAVVNVLLLENRMSIHEDRGVISYSELVEEVCSIVMEARMKRLATDQKLVGNSPSSGIALDGSHELDSILEQLPLLRRGLDLNVLFRSVDGFEFTSQLSLFDALRIELLHGWVADPGHEVYTYVKDLSYNQAINKLVEYRSNLDLGKDYDTGGASIETFINETASQLTYTGLLQLHERTREKQLLVLFRNNHYSTLFNYCGGLYILVTDSGYLNHAGVIWEQLDDIDGNTEHFDASFKLSARNDAQPSTSITSLNLDSLLPLLNQSPAPPSSGTMAQPPLVPTVVKVPSGDYLVALKLQEEEEAQYLQSVDARVDTDFTAQFTPEEIEALRREEEYYQELKRTKPSDGTPGPSPVPSRDEDKKSNCILG